MRSGTFARAGGFWSLLGAFLHVISVGYLAAEFSYPGVLDDPARDVFPALLSGGAMLRAMWLIYAVSPFVYVPMAVAAYTALKPYGRATTRIALMFSVFASLGTSLGALRWPSIHWELAQVWQISGPSQQETLAAVFRGVNSYFGLHVGVFIGEYALAIFALLIAAIVLRGGPFPRWFGWIGLVISLLLMVFAWRWSFPPGAIEVLTFISNILLMFWLVMFGAVFIIYAKRYDEGRFRML